MKCTAVIYAHEESPNTGPQGESCRPNPQAEPCRQRSHIYWKSNGCPGEQQALAYTTLRGHKAEESVGVKDHCWLLGALEVKAEGSFCPGSWKQPPLQAAVTGMLNPAKATLVQLKTPQAGLS